jgi:hypothetical protein
MMGERFQPGERVMYACGPTLWKAGIVERVRGNRVEIIVGVGPNLHLIIEERDMKNVKLAPQP